MWTVPRQRRPEADVVAFYEAEKPTAALCHGVSALIDVQPLRRLLPGQGKTVTGFANVEEDFSDQPSARSDALPHRRRLRERDANYVKPACSRRSPSATAG